MPQVRTGHTVETVTEEQITTMLVDDPRRYLENVGAY